MQTKRAVTKNMVTLKIANIKVHVQSQRTQGIQKQEEYKKMLRLNDLMKRIGKLKWSHQRFGQYAREEIRIPTKLFKKKKNIFIINYYSTSATGFPLLFPEYLNTRY